MNLIDKLSVIDELNAIIPYGNIKVESLSLYWFDEFDSDEENEPHDISWNRYCEVISELQRHHPEIEIIDYWADNDSQGFEILDL